MHSAHKQDMYASHRTEPFVCKYIAKSVGVYDTIDSGHVFNSRINIYILES